MGLEMKSSCQQCGCNLTQDGEARICAHECTFCPACSEAMENVCPNCGGELVTRPKKATRADGSA